MAVALHGKTTKVTFTPAGGGGAVDLTPLVNTTGIEQSIEDGDVTTFVDNARKFVPGLIDNGEMALEGPFTKELWAALKNELGVEGATIRIDAGEGATGMPYVTASGFINKRSASFDVGDPAGISAGFKVNGGITDGIN